MYMVALPDTLSEGVFAVATLELLKKTMTSLLRAMTLTVVWALRGSEGVSIPQFQSVRIPTPTRKRVPAIMMLGMELPIPDVWLLALYLRMLLHPSRATKGVSVKLSS
jgi:hypothetical protein